MEAEKLRENVVGKLLFDMKLVSPMVPKELEYNARQLADDILQAFNQWLEEQGASHRVKCPHCNWSQVYDGEAIAMSPCNECNSTGYTFKPLRLEIE